MQACGLRPWCLYLQGLCLQIEPFPGSKSVWPWSPCGLTAWSAGRDFSRTVSGGRKTPAWRQENRIILFHRYLHPAPAITGRRAWSGLEMGELQTRRTYTPDHQGSMSPTLQPASRELRYDHPPRVLSKDDPTKYFLSDSSLKENFGKADAERAHSNNKRSDEVWLK